MLVLDTPVWGQLGDRTVLCSLGQRVANFSRIGGAGHPDVPDEATYAGDLNADGKVDPVYGHAEFIESIITRVAPDVQVFHEPVITNFGASTDTIMARQLLAFLDASDAHERPGVVTLSVGGYSEGDQEPIALRAAVDEVVSRGWIVVASAGNDSSCRPVWPAAFPNVIGVGALGPSGPAPFTNYGGWVNACAPGVDVEGELPDPYLDLSTDLSGYQQVGEHPGAHVGEAAAATTMVDVTVVVDIDVDADPSTDGLMAGQGTARRGRTSALWSGTSFSAPLVAAAIARRATALAGSGAVTAENLTQAADDIVHDEQLYRLPGLGTVVNIT